MQREKCCKSSKMSPRTLFLGPKRLGFFKDASKIISLETSLRDSNEGEKEVNVGEGPTRYCGEAREGDTCM